MYDKCVWWPGRSCGSPEDEQRSGRPADDEMKVSGGVEVQPAPTATWPRQRCRAVSQGRVTGSDGSRCFPTPPSDLFYRPSVSDTRLDEWRSGACPSCVASRSSERQIIRGLTRRAPQPARSPLALRPARVVLDSCRGMPGAERQRSLRGN